MSQASRASSAGGRCKLGPNALLVRHMSARGESKEAVRTELYDRHLLKARVSQLISENYGKAPPDDAAAVPPPAAVPSVTVATPSALVRRPGTSPEGNRANRTRWTAGFFATASGSSIIVDEDGVASTAPATPVADPAPSPAPAPAPIVQ